MTRTDVIVIGGGVIGSAIAYELSKAGRRVTLFEKDAVASGASGMSAAMLEAQLDSKGPGPFSDLLIASRALFPALAKELQTLTGSDIGLEFSGILQLAEDNAEQRRLTAQYQWQRSNGWSVEWLETSDVRNRVPGLKAASFGGLFFAGDGQVIASRLTHALAEGARRLGAALQEGTGVTELIVEGGRIRGVIAGGKRFEADHVVIAAGPWSGTLAAMLGFSFPIEPVRGQILMFKTPRRLLPFPVYTSGGYLVPKPDGTMLAGTTTERVGFNSDTTEGALETLQAFALDRFPALGDQPYIGGTAGLRPGAPPDGLPLIGSVPGVEGAWVASGHFRNGMLLAPITARILAALVQGKPPPAAIEAFSPSRFCLQNA